MSIYLFPCDYVKYVQNFIDKFDKGVDMCVRVLDRKHDSYLYYDITDFNPLSNVVTCKNFFGRKRRFMLHEVYASDDIKIIVNHKK